MTNNKGMTKSSTRDGDTEADDAVSTKEFLKNIGTCRKEARETKHFLRMIVRAGPNLKSEARKLWSEARELHLIFSKIWRSKQ
ncbi:MAG TPA: four helix bundle protein [Chthoniobacterales bacterium]|nr:four helix bundle protein [Chthoniobacterales bacterium]